MSKIRNTASMLRQGRDGNTTFYVKKGEQITRQAKNDTNYGATASRSTKQQTHRVKLANLVAFYAASKQWMKKAFETKAANISDYNKFVGLNMPLTTISLPKEIAAVKGCVVAPYIVSQGSLHSIAVTQSGSIWATDLSLGNLTISDVTTVAQFASALINNNKDVEEGMQLSFVSYQQSVDAFGIPRAICTAYEVRLDPKATDLNLRSFLPSFCCNTVTGKRLGTDANISVGGFAYVLSKTTENGLLVSTQALITNNDTLITKYTNDVQDAINSYGVNSDAFLDSVEASVIPTAAQPIYISAVQMGTKQVLSGAYLGTINSLSEGSSLTIKVANGGSKAVQSLTFQFLDGTSVSAEKSAGAVTMAAGSIVLSKSTLASKFSSDVAKPIAAINLTVADYDQTSIEFNTTVTKYTLTVSANPSNMGSVSGGGQYIEGEEVTVTATPNGGYYFEKWNDGVTTNPRVVTMSQNLSLVASFYDGTVPG